MTANGGGGARMRKARSRVPAAGRDSIAPTPERWWRGDVEAVDRAIADEAGRPSRPYRSIDTLAAMLRKGTITPEMRQAGEDFRALFALACLDPLRAPDLRRVPQGFREVPPGLRQAEARDRVWRALRLLGGIASPAGSCVWHVLGAEATLKDWALSQGWCGRPLSQETASGILVGALGVLQAHFGL